MNSIVLGSPLISGIVATLIVLVVGDFASTFFYHVPQHMWGKLHLRTHHDRKRSYWDHAVLSRSPVAGVATKEMTSPRRTSGSAARILPRLRHSRRSR